MESLSSVFNFVEVILFGIHSPDYLFTADKYIHEATRPCSAIMVLQRKKKNKNKKIVRVRLELPTLMLSARNAKRKEKFSL